VEKLLMNICSRGLYDHLEGGIARYSVDDQWIVPHFEKMLYDNILFIDLLTKFYQSIEDLENTGVSLKGLDEGLLDFPAKRFDEEIWLCWKEGETEIKFWHEKDTGFTGRKPISVSNESLV